MTAALGVLAGVGLIKFAIVATVAIALLLYLLKGVNFGHGQQKD
jgi:uncharacterized membrane protein YhiD involved in acid resistance